jgi:hypothetical protein
MATPAVGSSAANPVLLVYGAPINFTWTDPSLNVDGTAIVAGEVTGYTVGIRNTATAGSAAGTYPVTVAAPGATDASALASGAAAALVPGIYAAAIQTNGPVNSAWSVEIFFEVPTAPVVPETPAAPSNPQVT